MDWLKVCPPAVQMEQQPTDLFDTPPNQTEIDFEAREAETYICGNPPYRGGTWQTAEHKNDLEGIFKNRTSSWKSLDYVAGWFMKAVDYSIAAKSSSAFVSTNSICQGQHVPTLWPLILATGNEISFAHTSFKWANLASKNAGVTVVIVGLSKHAGKVRLLFTEQKEYEVLASETDNINAYLVPGKNIVVQKIAQPPDIRATMTWGNKPADGGHLILARAVADGVERREPHAKEFIRRFLGANEYINGIQRYCLWIPEEALNRAKQVAAINERFKLVNKMRASSPKIPTREAGNTPHRFVELRQSGNEKIIVVPGISSEGRDYLPCGVLERGTILSNKN